MQGIKVCTMSFLKRHATRAVFLEGGTGGQTVPNRLFIQAAYDYSIGKQNGRSQHDRLCHHFG